MTTEVLQQVPQAHLPEKPLAISFRWLLGVYAIIPICLLLQLVDSQFWGGFLKDALPTSPNHFVFFNILFGIPHIVASAVVMTSNVDYLKTFKVKVIAMTLALAVFFGLGSQWLPYYFMYILVASWTVLHVLKQQHGLARGVCQLSDRQFNIQLYLSVAAGILVYIGIFLKNNLSPAEVLVIKSLISVLSIALVVSTFSCQKSVPTLFGKMFLWANAFLVFSGFYLFAHEHYFLAILVPRLVHDITAYIFYVTHDYNRHSVEPRNFIYRGAKKIGLSIFLVLPLLSFAIAFGLQQYGDYICQVLIEFFFGVEIRRVVTLVVIGYLSLMHYYTESFTWKGDSPYRQFITFTK
ncbi:MAG: hypothetical protein QF470_07765 [Methylococcales bacterium]|nr:hypothetical protein [Methylococcales bacterium]